ncbi:hypothetical protein ACP70R_048021 [Stipagrostis hirtigluma subsp. patula]
MVGVEAAILPAAMSGTLKIVGDKLAPLLLKEYTSIMGVEDDLKGLYDLVKEINEWLETMGDKASWNYPSFTWLKKLNDVSYDVDDLVDEFHLEAEKHEANGDSGRSSVSKFLCTKPKSFVFQCKAAHRLKAIKKRFAAIVKQRTEFNAIANSVPVGRPVQHIDKTTEEMPSLPNVDEASVFGRDQDKCHIISKLVEASDDRQKIKIVSIIGLGGSGKTTLAKLVFNDGNIINNHFEVRLWVHVSQEFNVQKLIHKLFEAFSNDKSECHPLQHMTNEISKKLSGKRFLLVMDDVWTDCTDSRILWENFVVHLKSGTPGSRILLTARSSRVAETVGSTDLFDLPFLSEDDSWQLFQQSFITPAKLLEFEFAEAGKEMVKKCGGVPLAIKVLAGALRDKEMVQEWHAMRDSSLLDVEGEESIVSISACLKLSYSRLPPHLKQCFTICSVFPKGYEVDKDQLIDQWVAQDIITLVDEYSGSKCFNYLVQISFLQDVNEYGGRVTCKMHDLVHDFARSILGDEISSGVPKEAVSSTKKYRYFCLTEKLGNLPPEYFEKARSVYVGLEGLDFISDKTLKNAKHLRSITLEFCFPGEVLAAILQGKNLKYLEIRHLYSEAVLKVISNIWSLQALHIRSSSFDRLPESIGKLQKLRTFDLSNCSNLESLPDSIGKLQKLIRFHLSNCSFESLPDSIGKLQKLRTLNLVDCSGLQSLPDSIGDCQMISSINLSRCSSLKLLPSSVCKLRELRKLDLSDCFKLESLSNSIGDCGMISSINLSYCSSLKVLPNSLGKLQELKSLDLSNCIELESLPDSIGDCRMISRINLSYCLSLKVLPNSFGKLQELRALDLSNCFKLESLPDSIGDCCMISSINLSSCLSLKVWPNSFGKLQALRSLDLSHFFELESLPDSIGKIQELRTLNLSGCSRLQNLPDAIGDCHMISSINLSSCHSLKVLPNSVGKLQELRTLDLSWCYKLESLPDSIGGNKNLRVLKLGHTQVERLPSVMTTLGHLERLDLEWCGKLVELPEGIGNLEKLKVLNLEHCELLRAMPIGIGQLTRVQKFLYVVGEGEKSARISELANISRICEDLTIRGIACVLHPDDAQKVCLKEKANLKRLKLEWGRNDTDDVHIEMEQAVLDCLEPPSGIEKLYIGEYAGSHFARWMLKQFGCVKPVLPPQSFPCLTEMALSDLPNLKHLEGLVEMPCLKDLSLICMLNLESISGGPFPSLAKLVMHRLDSLGDVWMVTERDLACEEDGGGGSNHSPHHLAKVHIGSRLTDLTIRQCDSLMVKPCFPSSLQRLVLDQSNEQLLELPHQGQGSSYCSSLPPSFSFSHLKELELCCLSGLPSGRGWELLLHMTAIESLVIDECVDLTKLPESMRSLASLKSLEIHKCSDILMLPEWLGELLSLEEMTIDSCDALVGILPQSVGHLASSLRVLRISECDALQQLPECLGELRSLREFDIKTLSGLTCLPQSMCRLTSLEKITISHCPGLTSLPEWIQGLTALHVLRISGCPDLERRCESGKGQDWHLISHIPHLFIA